AALRRIALAPRPAENPLARARGIPAGRRFGRSWTVPASFLVGTRHSDEGCRSLRRRRAGLRPRLRRVPGRAREARRQRFALLERPSARRGALRPLRGLSWRSTTARSSPRRRAPQRRHDLGRRLGQGGASGAVAGLIPMRRAVLLYGLL